MAEGRCGLPCHLPDRKGPGRRHQNIETSAANSLDQDSDVMDPGLREARHRKRFETKIDGRKTHHHLHRVKTLDPNDVSRAGEIECERPGNIQTRYDIGKRQRVGMTQE